MGKEQEKDKKKGWMKIKRKFTRKNVTSEKRPSCGAGNGGASKSMLSEFDDTLYHSAVRTLLQKKREFWKEGEKDEIA